MVVFGCRRAQRWADAVTVEVTRTAVGTADLVYRRAEAGAVCWVRDHRGQLQELPMARWRGGAHATAHDQAADEYVLGHCMGPPTIDLGCGPGRFVAALQDRGRPALGVDSSRAAVAWTRRRGGVAICRDLFAALPGEGRWGQVLLVDGNIGIGGDPVRTLGRAARLLAPGGTVIVETEPSATAWHQEMLRWETHEHVGPWFPWSRVGATVLGDIAGAAGLAVCSVVEIHTRVVAVLTASGCDAGRPIHPTPLT